MTFSNIKKLAAAVAASRRGATAIEYGLIAALVAGVVVTGVGAVNGSLGTSFTGVSTQITNATPK